MNVQVREPTGNAVRCNYKTATISGALAEYLGRLVGERQSLTVAGAGPLTPESLALRARPPLPIVCHVTFLA